ncbi:MAG TPA: hypothetical protein VM241_03040 [Candidatus Thermoplasmatota archaeon]|nr:hypothetical protein [Candidatus Thermoplasmatota archaeon]
MSPSRTTLASRLAVLALAALLAAPLADASLYTESNGSGSSSYYIYNYQSSNEHWSGQTFKLGSGYNGHYLKDIQVKMASTSSIGNLCAFYGPVGSSSNNNWWATKCVGAGIGNTPTMVYFDFTSPTSGANQPLAANTAYEFYVYYTATCTNCVRTIYSGSDVYRPGESLTKLSKEGTSFFYYPSEDLVFTIETFHSPVVATELPIFAQDAGGVKITWTGTTSDAGGLSPTMYLDTGAGAIGSGFDNVLNAGTCAEGFSCWVAVWPYAQHTAFHYRARGVNSAGTGYGIERGFTTPNYPPGTASTPSGPAYARPGYTQWFYSSASDPNDFLWYDLDVNGDGTADAGSSGTYSSGSTGAVSYAFPSAGTYSVRMRARDTSGQGNANGAWSPTASVIVDGTPPTAGTITSSLTAAPAWNSNASPTFNWNPSDAGGSQLVGGSQGSSHRLDGAGGSGYYSHATAGYSGLADGAHTFYVDTLDNAGNSATGTFSFNIDTQPPYQAQPAVSSGTLGQNTWYTSAVTLRIDSADAGSGISCEAHSTSPGAGYTSCVSADTWSLPADGSYTYYGRAEDNAAPHGVRQGIDSLALKMDRGAPTITDGAPDFTWRNTNPMLNVDFGDAMSGLWALEYTIWSGTGMTGTQLKPWTSFFGTTGDGTTSYTADWQADSSAFQQGNNYVTVRVTDRAGLVATKEVTLIQWDSVSPARATPTYTPGSSTVGDNGWYRADVGLYVDSADATSGIKGEAHTNVAAPSCVPGSNPADAWTDASEGTESWWGCAADNAGNSFTSDPTPFKMDKTNPLAAPTLAGTLGTAGWYTTNVVATVSGTDAVSGVASIRSRADSGGWTTTPGSSANVAVNGDGTHTVSYYARDNAGNVDGTDAAPKTTTVKVDTTPPASSHSVAGTAGLSGWYTSAVTVTVTSTDATSGASQVWYQLDGQGWTTVAAASANVPVTGEGLHALDYYAVDVAGNADGTQTTPHTATFKIDTVAPATSDSLSGTAGAAGWYKSPVTVTLLPTDATSGVLESRYGINVATTPTLYTGAFTVANEGTTQLYYRSKDAAGNVESVVQRAIRVDTLAPTLAAWTQTPANVDAGYAGSVDVKVSVDPGPSGLQAAEARHSYDNGLTWSAWSPTTQVLGTQRQFTIPAPAGGWWQYKEGTLLYEVHATDVAGNEATTQRSEALERVAPVVAIQQPIVNANWAGIQPIQWTGQDLDHDGVTYTVRLSNDGGATYYTTLDTVTASEDGNVNAYSYTFDTTAATNGANYAVKVEANDGQATSSAVVVPFRIDNTAPTVVLASPAAGTLTVQDVTVGADPVFGQTRVVGTAVTLRATAADPGAAASGVQEVRFWVDGTPVGIDGTPNGSGQYEATWDLVGVLGTHTVTVQSVDRAGNLSPVRSRDVVVVTDALGG